MLKSRSLQRFYIIILIIWSMTYMVTSCSLRRPVHDVRSFKNLLDYQGDTSSHWIRIRQDTAWGFLHAEGKWIIPPQFDWAMDFSDGHALVRKDTHYGYIRTDGKRLGKLRYEDAFPFSQGLAPVKHRGRYGVINDKGRWVVSPRYELVLPFTHNRALVVRNGLSGFIDKEGKEVVPPSYDDATPFKDGLAIVRRDGIFGLIDSMGKEVVPPIHKSIVTLDNGGYRITDKYGRVGETGANGGLRFEVVYEQLLEAYESIRLFQREGKYGFADTTGKMIADAIYTDAGVFSEGRAAVKLQDKWGYIDRSGHLVIAYQFKGHFEQGKYWRMRFQEHRAWVRHADETLLIDTTGRVIARTDYDLPYQFYANRALVGKSTGKYTVQYGYVDRTGRLVIPMEHDGGRSFNDHGIAWITKRDDLSSTSYFIDTSGYLLDGKAYRDLNTFGSRYIYNDRMQEKDFFDARTAKAIDFPYTNIYRNQGMDERYFFIQADSGTGLMDTAMRIIIPPKYRTVESLYRNRAVVGDEEKYGYCDDKGRTIIPLIYDKASYFRYAVTEVQQRYQYRRVESMGRETGPINTIWKHGVIDIEGKVVVPIRYQGIRIDNENNRIIAKDSASYDVYDMHGRLLSAGEYEYVGGFYYGNRSSIRKNGKVGAVDYLFRELCPPIYDRIGTFYAEDMAWVVNEGKIGYLNKDYEIKIPLIYEDGDIFVMGMAKVKLHGEEMYVDGEGKRVYPDEQTILERDKAIEKIKNAVPEFSS
ncbi:WG repeat-containing protein [Parapedobacter tibetensis]|uniref:WG repeat-containing protein n=1 Tax=Parapedobacter tibetensis TaxID=2972951 RepID=UPI00214DA2A7|nr:WG repeat-containing protein [Parapedobacter tibetensis]